MVARMEAHFASILCYLLVLKQVTSVPVNVALNKPVTAEIRCGQFSRTNVEEFFGHSQVFLQPRNRILQTCTNTTYPPKNMVDNSTSTWWQSASRTVLIEQGFGTNSQTREIVIYLDLIQEYDIQKITLTMGDSKRPGQIALFKENTVSIPWIYRVTNEYECGTIFGTSILQSPTSNSSVVCSAYSSLMTANYEKIAFDFTNVPYLAWRKAKKIKIQFYNMALTLGANAPRFHHYTVSDIEVLAECNCGGQHVGCNISSTSGQYECVCGGNTQGKYCEQCKPFYNQKPYVKGTPCEVCNCFGHADTCRYDKSTDDNNYSLNAQGVHSGGGNCIGCSDNTTGINCERCVHYYYRPIDVPQSQKNACIPCECNSNGSVTSPLTSQLGDCLTNNNVSLPPNLASKKPGDCFCKANVEGSKCDKCKPGFFNLTSDKVTGCQGCTCNNMGTVNGSNVCMANNIGQCPCKQFTTNRQCDACLSGYYGLNANNTEGCLNCACDIGGALNSVCDPVTGQCLCRLNVIERQCKRPAANFYYPTLHFISVQAERMTTSMHRSTSGYMEFGYAIIQNRTTYNVELLFPIKSDFTGEVTLQLRYASNTTVAVALTLTPAVNGGLATQVNLPKCSTPWCNAQVNKTITMKKGIPYSINIVADSSFFLDEIVALPVEFVNTTAMLGNKSAAFQSTCDVQKNDMKLNTTDEAFCLNSVFSLTTYYLNGSLPCNCDSQGSYNQSCAIYGGQCPCKPGVGGRRCDVCLPEFYNLTSMGCTACNCSGLEKICNQGSGQCVCPMNVVGRQCDQCAANHWNWTITTGCQSCNCNTIASSSLQCNLSTGVCPCKNGVGGVNCDVCLDNFAGYNPLGCAPCNCDAAGSLSPVCNKTSFQCSCKNNTRGLECKTCAPATFYNAPSHTTGCLDCVCMGVSNVCTSTTLKLQTIKLPLFNSSSNQSDFRLSTLSQTLSIPTVSSMFNNTPVLSAVVGVTAYWVPVPPTTFTGDMLGIYENTITFKVQWSSIDVNAAPLTNLAVYILGRNNTLLKIPVPAVVKDNVTDVVVKVTEMDVVTQQDGVISRQNLLLALTDVKEVYFPASFYGGSQTTRLFGVSYNIASQSGTGSPSLGVEQCTCGPQYQGTSCQNCAVGYKRANVTSHSYLGVCVPCQCNGHSSQCDANTGECLNCQHNTAGAHCEMCAAGYYGDATKGLPTDCTACPCLSPRVVNATCNITNGKPVCQYCADGYTGELCDSCLPFYYGNPEVPNTGQCDRCNCSGNTAQCNNRNGQCLNCGFNSTGFNCERCKDNWFGNASAQACQDCNCDMNGSNSTVCNHVTGQCSCLPGVGNRTCDRCLPNYYGYSNKTIFGCVPCMCNPGGSVSLQCNEQGICPCNNVSGSAKCDFCAEQYYGLPHKPCESCDCNFTGSVNSSAPCERVLGQCGCRPGVTSRNCDSCERLYTGFSNTGCTQCGVCQTSLGNDTLKMKQRLDGFLNQTLEVAAVQAQDGTLQVLTLEINKTSSLLGVSSNRLNELTSTVATLNSQETSYNNSVNSFMGEVMSLLSNTERQANISVAENERIKLLQVAATNMSSQVVQLNTSSAARVNLLESFVSQSLVLLSNSLKLRKTEVNVSFSNELQTATLELNLTLNTKTKAQTMAQQVIAQETEIEKLRNATTLAQSEFVNLKKPLDDAINNTQAIKDVLKTVWQNVNTTEANRAYIQNLLNKTRGILNLSVSILEECQAAYLEGSRMFLDTKTIIDGLANGTILPINTTVDLSNVPSFNQGADYIEKVELPPLNQSLNNITQSDLPKLRAYVTELTQQATANNRIFKTAQPSGQQAVDAITTYETVITSLTEAHKLALAANQTMQQALEQLQSVSVADLQQQAVNMVSTAASLMANVSTYDTTASTLQQQLNQANTSLSSAIIIWQGLSTRIAVVNASSAALSVTSNDPRLSSNITIGLSDAAVLLKSTDLLNSQAVSLEQAITVQEGQLTVVQETVNNATLIKQQVTADLATFTPKLNSIQNTINLTNSSYLASSSIKDRIEARILQVEKKVQQAREMLAKMEQPVSYISQAFEQIPSPKATPNMQYNEIMFDFKYDQTAQGILFFTENNATKEKLLIQMTGGQLVFEFSNVDKTFKAVSQTVLCAGCWFRVLATRYGIDIQLTVTKISTGGTAVTHVRGGSTLNQKLTLTSPIFVAGLPQGYDQTKVNPGTSLQGCIYKLTFDGFTIPLWQNALQKDSKAQCCTPPPALPTPSTTTALTFTGFNSYAKADLSSLPIANSHISLQFRTFSPDGVLFLADSPGISAYYGLVLQSGRVVLVVVAGGQTVELTVNQIYSTGAWYQVTAQFNSTYALLHLEQQGNGNTWVTNEVKSQSHTVNLAQLTAPQFTLGGQNPNTTTSPGPVTRSFAGCIQSLQHNTGANMALSSVSLSTVITDSSGVSNNSCYIQAVSGVGISTQLGYVALNNIPNPATYFVFEVLTYQPNGILLYAELSANPPTTFLYVALYHGDIMVFFNQGSGLQTPLRSRGLYLANGLAYTITLDFRFQNSPRLMVSGQTHYGTSTMTSGMALRNNRIYVGGVAPGVTLDTADLPVTHGIIGGIRNIRVNTQLINYNTNVDGTLHKDAYLSGLPAPPSSPPPPPYPTTPAPPTTPTVPCAPSSIFRMSSVGVRFGDTVRSYMAFALNNLTLLDHSFVIRTEFRAVQPNGIILYMSSSSTNPRYYLCLFMEGGYLKMSMQTNSSSSQTSQATKNITSKFTYNDGRWWKVDAVRLNDFMALVVTGNKTDYINNNQKSSAVTSLLINSPVYVGGVTEQHVGAPFGQAAEIGIGTASFHGCIKKIEISSSNTQLVNLNFTAPLDSKGVSQCFDQVHPGVFLNSTNAYIKVEDDIKKLFNIVPSFEIYIQFRSSNLNGTLAVAYQSSSKFFLIDIINGQICILIGNSQVPSAPLIAKSSTLDVGNSLCNGALNNMAVRIGTTNLMFNFNSTGWETISYPSNFAPPDITNAMLYTGGIKDRTWTFPVITSKESFHGCLQTVSINSKDFNLVASTDKASVVAGCPA